MDHADAESARAPKQADGVAVAPLDGDAMIPRERVLVVVKHEKPDRTPSDFWAEPPAWPFGGSIVDTPGFQEFGLAHVPVGQLAESFPEFRPALGQCRFQDCRHLTEPGCAVRALVGDGKVAADRYAFYRSLAEARPL